MKCHQVLTGAVNSGDNTYSTGSVEGIRFTAYCSGCNIVILSSDFQRVQIIPGVLNGNVQVNCIDASTDVGKVAVCYGGPIKTAPTLGSNQQQQCSTNKIVIFEPTPLIGQISEHRLDYRWIKTGEIEPNFPVSVLSWNLEGTKLLIGGVNIQLWQLDAEIPKSTNTDEGLSMKPLTNDVSHKDWNCVWSCKPASPVHYLSFSPDGTLFCSTGKNDRLVKIWHESSTQSQNFQALFDSNTNLSATSLSNLVPINNKLSYNFIYIAHPRAVTGISWRKVSKYMPKSSVANMLVTSCRDNICRVWVQTFLPDDGLVNVSQLNGVSNYVSPGSQTKRNRDKILNRLKSMTSFTHFHRRQRSHEPGSENSRPAESTNIQRSFSHDGFDGGRPIPNLPSSYSVHDFHGFSVHGTSITPGGLHFHLTASINAENDIPLVPSLTAHHSDGNATQTSSGPKVTIQNDEPRPNSPSFPNGHHGYHHHEESDKPLFVVNWLNNKEMVFTQNAEKILHEIVSNIIQGEKRMQEEKLRKEQEEKMKTENDDESEENQDQVPSVTTRGPGMAAPVVTSHENSSNTSLSSPNESLSTEIKDRKTVADYLDKKLEALIRDWHRSSDLLYSIHPLDGSLLVWLVEYLDEPSPSTFPQPQISFSSRIPNSIPLGDASTMSQNVSLYSAGCFLDLKIALFGTSANLISAINSDPAGVQMQQTLISLAHKSQQQHYQQQQPLFGFDSNSGSIVCMVTKHNNGSLNLWKLSFAERTKYNQLMSIGHSKRVCGHRFRVNDVTCHSILPLMLTTSHHNLPGTEHSAEQSRNKLSHSSPFDLHTPNTPDSTSFLVSPSNAESSQHAGLVESSTLPNTGFCSELILWKVDPVGPLLKSGGVSELARINSLEPTAFANVAWIPTLLPSSALGTISNSSSSCFVASDGRQLRIYQAVIDARSLLAEAQRYMINTNDQRRFYYDSSDEDDDDDIHEKHHRVPNSKNDHEAFRSLFKIVSLQSTSRPGCVLELNPIVDARHNWQNTQLLHVFPEQMIVGNQVKLKKNPKTSVRPSSAMGNAPEIQFSNGPAIDLSIGVFEEVFYLVVIEKSGTKSTLHMWEITITSRGKASLDAIQNVSSTLLNADVDEESSRSATPESGQPDTNFTHSPPLKVRTKKVSTQILPLPVDVEIIHAVPAAGHLSSSNIYPACYAPFLLTTACSDSKVRFWRCDVTLNNDETAVSTLSWSEWQMNMDMTQRRTSIDDDESSSSSIELPGVPIYISCAFSGKIAVAFKYGHSYMDGDDESPNRNRFIDIGIAIYECESSGGSEWILEDTIKVDRIPLMEGTSKRIEDNIDISSLVDTSLRNQQTSRKLATKMSSNQLAMLTSNPFNPSSEVQEALAMTQHHLDMSVQQNRIGTIQRLLSVPSYTTIQSLRKIIAEQGNQFTFYQKSPVLLDWVSMEDGSHILTCSAGHKITVFAPVMKALKDVAPPAPKQSDFQKFPSLSTIHSVSSTATLIPQQSFASSSISPSNLRQSMLEQNSSPQMVTKWMVLRGTELSSADGLPPLPMQLAWVRDGLLVVGMDNEMIVYSQWKTNVSGTLLEMCKIDCETKPAPNSDYPVDSVDISADRFQQETDASKDVGEETGDKIISEIPEDFGMFEAFRLSSPVLPQYHPKQLMELLAFGKIHRVRAILSHLVSSLCSINSIKEYLHHPSQLQHSSFEAEKSPRGWTRTRALSIAQAPSPHDFNISPLDGTNNEAPIIAEEIQLDYTEIASIRPLPLYALKLADKGISTEKKKENKQKSHITDSGFSFNLDGSEDQTGLFDSSYRSQVEETLDEFLGNRNAFNFSNIATSKFLNQSGSGRPEVDTEMRVSIKFDQKQSRLLTRLLTHSHLPGMTSLDQMQLLALADSLASFGDAEDPDISGDYSDSTHDESGEQTLINPNSLDDCGLRYLLNMRQHVYLLKCLPLRQRKMLQIKGLAMHNIIWAFHSEAQEELVQMITSSNKISWQDLKELGVGYWARSNTLLIKIVDKLAKSSFKKNNDPLDASLFYLAMKKKNLVWGLYRSIGDKRMTDFFSNDFTQDKWRKAALKNAYALMGHQRFEHAASFFLLAGNLWDAVEICYNRLDDLQLAMTIVRLHEGGHVGTVPETLKKLLNQDILGFQNGVQNMEFAHPDPFLRSMAYWMLQDYNKSLSTLLEVNVGFKHPKFTSRDHSVRSTLSTPAPGKETSNLESLHPSVFNFYLYLRTQPLIVRRAQVAAQKSVSIDVTRYEPGKTQQKKSHMFSIGSGAITSDSLAITSFERKLFFLTAHRHMRAGCPALALEVLSRLPSNVVSNSEKDALDRRMSIPEEGSETPKNIETATSLMNNFGTNGGGGGGTFGSSAFNWSEPATDMADKEEEFEIKFDDDEPDEDEEDDSGGLQMKTVSEADKKKDEPKPETTEESKSTKVDVIGQQFKYIACLKIMMEELSTLATGFEVDGGQLRYQLYIWLERSVNVLKEVCNYQTFSLRTKATRSSMDMSKAQDSSGNVLVATLREHRFSESSPNSESVTAPSLHEILLADREDFESKMERCKKRKAWLTDNEALLRNLLSYCSLHGAHGGGLASVRMELILLLQELQQDRSPQQQLLSPLPLPTTLPLLTATVASQKTIVADPIRHLQNVIHDILKTLADINTYVHMPHNTNLSSLPDFLALPPFMVSGTATSLTAWSASVDQQSNYATDLYGLIHILRDLGISLSACLYQSLCDCDTVTQASSIAANSSQANRYKSHRLASGRKSFLARYRSTRNNPIESNVASAAAATGPGEEQPCVPQTAPTKWPGVPALLAMLGREKDEDLPMLHTLLCEGFVAVFASQLVYALTICDSSILYRLAGLKFDEKSWGDLFGGGAKKLLYVSVNSILNGMGATPGTVSPNDGRMKSGQGDMFDTLHKQRVKFHMKILEQFNQASAMASEAVSAVSQGVVQAATSPSTTLQNIGAQLTQMPGSGPVLGLSSAPGNATEQRPTYREVFVPPQISIVNYLMMKPELPDELVHVDYDSMGSDDEIGADENEDTSGISGKFRTEAVDDDIDDEEYENYASGGAKNPKVDRAAERKKANLEYELYAWCIMRLAITKIAYEQLDKFLTVSGIEKGDLPTVSPHIHGIMKSLKRWQHSLQFYMNEFTNLPDHFLPNMYVDSEKTSPLQKYKSLLETNNSPFRSGATTIKASKRLWNYLVRQKNTTDIFIRYIFAKSNSIKLAKENGATAICCSMSGVALSENTETDHKTTASNNEEKNNDNSTSCADKVGLTVILHKDAEQISAFCLNRSNSTLVAFATPREIQELNIKNLLNDCVPFLEEGAEIDIQNIRMREDLGFSSHADFLLVQHPSDRLLTSPGGQAHMRQVPTGQSNQTPSKQVILSKHHFKGNTNPHFCKYVFERSRHIFLPIKRHKTDTVRRLTAHPTLPLYLSGGQDGAVQLWEWNHQQPISTPRAAGQFNKVTRLQFNQQGNKFGVADGDGNLSLWQVSTNQNRPFFHYQCHNKGMSDFTFLGASSMLTTAGQSSDHKNVCVWDTLMPPKKCMIHSFQCHDSGASAIAYASMNQILITGGKKGEVCLFDMRQRVQKDRFTAHESAVKCIAIDPTEEFFATGSADGDIKVWSLIGTSRQLLFNFPQEHARSNFFRNIGMGVANLYIDNCGRLFSCGADGSLKMRHLPTSASDRFLICREYPGSTRSRDSRFPGFFFENNGFSN